MPRRKINVSGDAANAAPVVGFAQYDGPAGPLRVALKQLAVKDNKNGDPMFTYMVEVREPAGSSKAKHNGQSMFGQRTITEEFAGWVNGMLQGLGVPSSDIRAFWSSGLMVEKPDLTGKERVISIGKWKVPPEISCVILAKMGKSSNDAQGNSYEAKMEVSSFLINVEKDAPQTVEESDDEIDADALAPAEIDDDEIDEDDLDDESDEADDDEEEASAEDARADELEALSKANDRLALVKIAKGHGLTVLKKDSLDSIINKILDHEFGPVDEDEDEEPEEEEAAESAEPDAAPEPAPAATRAGARRSSTSKPPF